jgi:hypothetical protein
MAFPFVFCPVYAGETGAQSEFPQICKLLARHLLHIAKGANLSMLAWTVERGGSNPPV